MSLDLQKSASITAENDPSNVCCCKGLTPFKLCKQKQKSPPGFLIHNRAGAHRSSLPRRGTSRPIRSGPLFGYQKRLSRLRKTNRRERRKNLKRPDSSWHHRLERNSPHCSATWCILSSLVQCSTLRHCRNTSPAATKASRHIL